MPVVPVALRTDFWGNGRWIKDFGPINPKLPVRIAFGEALSPALRPADVQARVVAFVREHLLAWGVPCRAEAAESAGQGAAAGEDTPP